MRAAVVGVPVPSLEISLGILAWVVGGAGLANGLGTLLVALGVAAWSSHCTPSGDAECSG